MEEQQRRYFKIFKHLPNSEGKNQLVTYHLIPIKYSEHVFNLYMGLEFGKHLLKFVLYTLTCMMRHCLQQIVLYGSTLTTK
jgi:hypothetical protein